MQRYFSTIRPCGVSSIIRSQLKAPVPLVFKRNAGGRPEKQEFEKRALELLKGFEKIDPQKLSLTAHFTRDLGLDSLDTVEVLMAIEDEFMIEIPDQDVDNIHTVKEAVDYVYDKWTPQNYM